MRIPFTDVFVSQSVQLRKCSGERLQAVALLAMQEDSASRDLFVTVG